MRCWLDLSTENPFLLLENKITDTFVNREKEIDQFIRILSDLLEGRIPHIPILGNHGIGKTHFLKYMFELVKSNKSELILLKS